jgi:Domain of unknown function (DUF6899)
MPYIVPKHRWALDPLIDELAGRIAAQAKESKQDGAFAGLLNYTCTCLALKILRLQSRKMRYWQIALITGTFKNVVDEFYRRVAVPYEDRQMAQNGDVNLYKEYADGIGGQGSADSPEELV